MRVNCVKDKENAFYITLRDRRRIEFIITSLIELLDQVDGCPDIGDDDPNNDPLEDMEAWWQGCPEFRT